MTNRAEVIEAALRAGLSPAHLEVHNESHMHSVAPGSETHFKVVVVAEAFDALSLLARHRRVNELLAHELAHGLHALSIHAFSPAQWTVVEKNSLDSPKCKGGAGL